MALTFTPSRTLFKRLLNNTFLHRTVTRVSDGMGGATRTLSEGTSATGRLRPMKPEEIDTAARLDERADHVLYLEAPYSIPKDSIFEFRGEQYRVIGVQEPGYAEFFLQVHVRREI